MKIFLRHEIHNPSWNVFISRHGFFLFRHEIHYFSVMKFSVMKSIIPSWNPLFFRHEILFPPSWFCTFRNESFFGPSWNQTLVMKKFPVMNHSRRHEIHFFPSWNFVPSVMILHNWSWVGLIKQPRVVLIHAPKLHTFTHPAWHQSPQAQHEGVQGFSLFIQSGLQAELLLVLRIVTPVSVARTGGGICRQIVQFRACKFTELFGAFLVSMWWNTWFHDHGLTMATPLVCRNKRMNSLPFSQLWLSTRSLVYCVKKCIFQVQVTWSFEPRTSRTRARVSAHWAMDTKNLDSGL